MGTRLGQIRHNLLKLLAFIVLVVFAAGGPDAEAQTRRTEVPLLTDSDGRLVVEVRINGQGPLNFIIDTAATRSAIFERTRLALGLEMPENANATVITPFGTQSLPLTVPVRLDVGERSLSDLSAVVLPDWNGEEAGPDGFLGLDFLSPYFVSFRARDRVFAVYDEKPRELTADMVSVPIQGEYFGDLDAPVYFTFVRMGYRRFYTIFDTGSVSTVINWSAAQRFGLDPNSPDFKGGSMEDALGIERPVVGLRFSRIRLGDRLWRKEVILVADLKIFEAFGRADEPTGILGLDLLKQQDFAVDFPGKRLYVARRAYHRPPDPNNQRQESR